jgi:hypothetical protein
VSGFDDFEPDSFGVSDAEDTFDLSKERREKPHVVAGCADKPHGGPGVKESASVS